MKKTFLASAVLLAVSSMACASENFSFKTEVQQVDVTLYGQNSELQSGSKVVDIPDADVIGNIDIDSQIQPIKFAENATLTGKNITLKGKNEQR